MELTRIAFVGLLVLVGLGRLVEMRISRRHQKDLASRGARRMREPGFAWMVALHTGVLVSAAIEVIALRRPLVPAVAAPALIAFVLSNVLRIWVIRTLRHHWNVQIVDSLQLGVVTGGPYRLIRHPNYVAVFVELLALPLIHGAYVTALVGASVHVVVLARRIRLEERVLLGHAAYRAAFAERPRFLPRL